MKTPKNLSQKKKRIDKETGKFDEETSGLKASMRHMGRESLERLASCSSPGPSTSSSSIRKTRQELAELSKETLASLATTLSDSDDDSDINEEDLKEEYRNEDFDDLDRMEAKLEKKADKTRQKLRRKMEEKLKRVKSSEKADELTTIKTKLRILRDVRAERKKKFKDKTKAYLKEIKENGIMGTWKRSLAAKKERARLRDEANGITETKGKRIERPKKLKIVLITPYTNLLLIRGRKLSYPKAGLCDQKRIKRGEFLRRGQHIPPHRRRGASGKYSVIKSRLKWDILFQSESTYILQRYKNVFNDVHDTIKDDDSKRSLILYVIDNDDPHGDTIVSSHVTWSDLTKSYSYYPVFWTFMFQEESRRRDRAQEVQSQGRVQRGQARTGTKKDHGYTAPAIDPSYTFNITSPNPISSYYLPPRHCTELPGLSPDALT